jgi:Ca-activated chloride channel homolog
MYTKITLLALLILSTISAKSGIIAGKVTDAETGEALIGANVIILNSNWGAATDIDGFFKISSVPPGTYELRASFVGYSPQTIKDIIVKSFDSLFIEFKLESDFTLAEIVIIESKPLIERHSTNACRTTSYDNITVLPVRGVQDISSLNVQVGGYTAEFNQYNQSAPWNTEEYNTIVENEFLNAFSNPISTFSIDVDAASYSNARRFIMSGSLPPKDAVRIEEFVNYFDYDYPQPKNNNPFSITTEFGECPWNERKLFGSYRIKRKRTKR